MNTSLYSISDPFSRHHIITIPGITYSFSELIKLFIIVKFLMKYKM